MQRRYISYDKDYGFPNIYMTHPLYSASFRELVITLPFSHNIVVTIRIKASFKDLQTSIFFSVSPEVLKM